MVGNYRRVEEMNKPKDEHDIAVIPYVVYDALMERFERTQKNLRFSLVASSVLAVSLVFSVLVGIGATNGNCKNT